jgi:hypothetical protein
MEVEQKSTGKYWLWFFIWTIILILMLVFVRQFFWLALPGAVTYFAKAMDIV